MKDLPLDSLGFDTIAIHAGQSPDPSTGAIMTPIYQTSTYVQESPGKNKGYEYARSQNPTRTALEKNLAALEGATYGLAFSSGCGAMTNVMMTFQAGDHFIVCDDIYGGTYRLFTKILSRFQMEFSFVDCTDFDAVNRALKPNTKMLWLETPTNPLMKIFDIEKLSHWARSKNLLTLVDNTFASPALQNPLKLGADYVFHSTTKYLGGHSDVIGGALMMNAKNLYDLNQFNQKSIGATPGPMDCFLTLRGTKTLGVRLKKHSENAVQLAEWLTQHPKIEKVLYPGLKTHPGHEIAKKQMKDFGGMISLVVSGGFPAAKKLLEQTRVFSLAESLGGVESLINHPATMTHASIPKDIREKTGIVDGLVRLSVGIEHLDDLRNDLAQALEHV